MEEKDKQRAKLGKKQKKEEEVTYILNEKVKIDEFDFIEEENEEELINRKDKEEILQQTDL